jgi:hypothetical protein
MWDPTSTRSHRQDETASRCRVKRGNGSQAPHDSRRALIEKRCKVPAYLLRKVTGNTTRVESFTTRLADMWLPHRSRAHREEETTSRRTSEREPRQQKPPDTLSSRSVESMYQHICANTRPHSHGSRGNEVRSLQICGIPTIVSSPGETRKHRRKGSEEQQKSTGTL